MFNASYQVIATSYANLNLSVHQRIDDLYRRAEGLAAKVAESAADSGCTDTRPASGTRSQKAWDMIAEALAWNGISDCPSALEQAEQAEAAHMPYRVGSSTYDSHDGTYHYEIVTILPVPEKPKYNQFNPLLPRCANCGTNQRGARTLVIDWREDYLCDPCVDSFDWSEGWTYDGASYRRCCAQSDLTPGKHSTRCVTNA